MLDGDKIWGYVGRLSPKDKTQLEERIRRMPGAAKSTPPSPQKTETPMPAPVSRLQIGLPRPSSRAGGGIPRPASPAGSSRLAYPMSPGPSQLARPASPAVTARLPAASSSSTPMAKPKSMLPSRLGPPRPKVVTSQQPHERDLNTEHVNDSPTRELENYAPRSNGLGKQSVPSWDKEEADHQSTDVTVIISSILSSDPSRSVDALKKIQKILEQHPDGATSSPMFRDLADHTEGLIETITLQMAQVFERPTTIVEPANYRLSKHLIQTLNSFCDHAVLAESLTVEILTSVLEELTLRLLQTDESTDSKVKDLSRFINMIILRLFATGRRIAVFRYEPCMMHAPSRS